MRGPESVRLGVIFLLFLSQNLYSQNIFRFIGKGSALEIRRTITTNSININLARKILAAQGIRNIQVISPVSIQAVYTPGIVTPAIVIGPNSYLKGISKAFRGDEAWKRINLATSYNGAHHIVTKFVIKQIGGSDEAIKNGPSVFHPLHNKPEYIDLFHNHQRQLELYKSDGIKGIVQDFFNRIDGFTEEEVNIMLLEAELWAKHWGFKWQ